MALCLIAIGLATQSAAQTYSFSTLAGLAGTGSADGTGAAARFRYPGGVAIDATGNVYVADSENHTIRRITPAGIVTTMAGQAGVRGSADGTGGEARFWSPDAITIDTAGNLYVCDSGTYTVRKITPAGVVTTFAGTAGMPGSADGTGAAARFFSFGGIALDGAGNAYVSETQYHTIRKIVIATGVVTTIAGQASSPGKIDSVGTAARFNGPKGLAVSSGNLLIVDHWNQVVRKLVLATGSVTTFAGAGFSGTADGTGTTAQFSYPAGLTVDPAGNAYVADWSSHTIRKITPAGVVTTLAGQGGLRGSADGQGSVARFDRPQALAIDGASNVVVADWGNHVIRKIAPAGAVSTFAGAVGAGYVEGPVATARFNEPIGIALDAAGIAYVCDAANWALRKISPAGNVSTLASVFLPAGVTLNAAGDAFVAVPAAQIIVKVARDGVSEVFAGESMVRGSTDGTGGAARFNQPSGVAIDAAGNLYVADQVNYVIRKITPAGVVTTFAGSPGNAGSADGIGTAARFGWPVAVAVGSTGTVYVADSGNHTVRQISPAGVVTTLAGAAGSAFSVDGTGAGARFFAPLGIAVDTAGNVFVTEGSDTIRRVTPAGVATTIGGLAFAPGSSDGTGVAARFWGPRGMATDGDGRLYISDTGNNTIRLGVPMAVQDTPPVITLHPQSSATAAVTGNTTYRVEASGSPAPTFQWQRQPAGTSGFASVLNNSTFSGATTNALSVTAPTLAMDGDQFRCVASNSAGSATSDAATLTVLEPPVITSAANATFVVGAANTFAVTATGWPAPTFAINGGNFPSWATLNAATGEISGTPPNATGSPFTFNIRAGSEYQSAFQNITLTVAASPIATHPASQTVTVGQPATFSVTTTGSGLFTHQWRRNGVVIPGATNATFTIASVQRTDADFYDVEVTADAVKATSKAARLSVAPTRYPGAIAADPEFSVKLESGGASVHKLVPLADGRVLATGDFVRINGHATSGVARFTADGVIDTGFAASLPNGLVHGAVVQSDGKILAVGSFMRVGENDPAGIVRLNDDGRVDPTFRLVNDAGEPIGQYWLAIALTANGKILAVGPSGMFRFHSSGILDTQFNAPLSSYGPVVLAVAADEKILVAGQLLTPALGSTRIFVRLNADGTHDASFDTGALIGQGITNVIPLSDGKVLVSGASLVYENAPMPGVLRLNADGTRDSSFSPAAVPELVPPIYALAVDADGNVHAAGGATNVVRLSSTGALKSALPVSGFTYALLPRPDGSVWAGGDFSLLGASKMEALGKFVPGTLASTPIGTLVQRRGLAAALVPDSAGRLIIGGDFRSVNGTPISNLARVNASGAVDTSFNVGTGPSHPVRAVSRDSEGRLLIAGGFKSVNGAPRKHVARLHADGALDSGFSFDFPSTFEPTVGRATPAPGGQIYLLGQFFDSAVPSLSVMIRLNSGGSIDAGFAASDTVGLVNDYVVQADGKVVLVGNVLEAGTFPTRKIVRLRPDGTVDSAFNSAGAIWDYMLSTVEASASAKLVVGGKVIVEGASTPSIVRLNPDGAPDTSFDAPISELRGGVNGLLVQEDEKVITRTGVDGTTSPPKPPRIVRLSANGEIDPSFRFHGAGSSDHISALVMGDAGELYYSIENRGEVFRTAPAAAPIIAAPLAGQAVSVGATVTFTASATGLPAPMYQWFKDGGAIAGATNATFSISSATTGDTGNYSFAATNDLGAVSSSAAGLTVGFPAGADQFSARTLLSGNTAGAVVSNRGATKEAGEPSHAGNAGGKSVWWTWTAPANGYVTIDTIGSDFDTLLAVYTGGTVSTLIAVASDDNSGPAAGASKVTFAVTAGTIYQIAVDGAHGLSGDVTLNLGYAYAFATLAGHPGHGSADGTLEVAEFGYPDSVALDVAGNMFVADTANHTIRKISVTGVVTTIAGVAGQRGSVDGGDGAARFFYPTGITVDQNGTIFVADSMNHTIRRIDAAGAVTTIAGLAGVSGYADGVGSGARFNQPAGLAVDGSGVLYIADRFNHVIRKVAPDGTVSTLAGISGSAGLIDGLGNAARFNAPAAVAVDSGGNLFVADSWNHAVRKVTAAGLVTTFAGAGSEGSLDDVGGVARFYYPNGVAVDGAGNVFVADTSNHTVRKIGTDGTVTTIAGAAGVKGSTNGAGAAARFYSLRGIAAGGGNVFVADSGNSVIRRIAADGNVTTLAGILGGLGSVDGPGIAARFYSPNGLAADDHGNVFVADTGNHTIRKIMPDGSVTTFAGMAGQNGGVDGVGSMARFSSPRCIAIDRDGNLFVTDHGNHAVRRISPGGVVTTFAGVLGNFGSVDGTGNASRFFQPFGIALDNQGNLYVADEIAHTIRKITPAGAVTTFAGMAGVRGSSDGAGSAARFDFPRGVAVDAGGNIFVTESATATIRVISPAGEVTTFPGRGVGSADGVGRAAQFRGPIGLAGGAGAVFVADTDNQTIRRITAGGLVTTIGGLAEAFGIADGVGSQARFNGPIGIAVDGSGNIYVSEYTNERIRKGALAFAPQIQTQPLAQTAISGNVATLSVAAVSALPLSYQWLRDGQPIVGATSPSLTIANVQPADAGNYNVTISSAAGSTTSAAATFTVIATPVIETQYASRSVGVGGRTEFIVTAGGPGPFTYQWSRDGTPIAGATNSTFVIPAVSIADAGDFTVAITNSHGTTVSASGRLTLLPNPIVYSSRHYVGADGLTAYFAIEGPQPKKVLLRAVGPTLASFDIAGVLADPAIVLIAASGQDIAANNDWGTTAGVDLPAVFARLGAFPLPNGSKDAALLATLVPGTYAVRVTGTGGAGVALLEIYDADTNSVSRLAYVGFRGPGEVSAGISAGFAMSDAADKRVLIRAVGMQTLASRVAVANPRVQVRTGETILLENEDWAGAAALSDAAAQAGAFPLSPTANDAAALLGTRLGTNSYIAAIPAAAGTGEALLEFYDLPRSSSSQIAPLFIVSPLGHSAPAGSNITLGGAVVVGSGPITYQWRKHAVPINGATTAALAFPSLEASDAGAYDVVATNSFGTAISRPAGVAISSSLAMASHAVDGGGYVAGGTVTITNTLTYSATAASLGWEVTIPAGWSYASDTAMGIVTRPAAGATGRIEWAWDASPTSPMTFTYTLTVPASESGSRILTASAIVRSGASSPATPTATPAILTIEQKREHHSADTDRDLRINLIELTRVIELYNTRNGTTRTGAYKNEAAGEDGFAVDPARGPNTSAILAPYHSADTGGATFGSPRDGALDLFELTRVIQLYNVRNGTVRTGQYRVQSGTEDGFAPGF